MRRRTVRWLGVLLLMLGVSSASVPAVPAPAAAAAGPTAPLPLPSGQLTLPPRPDRPVARVTIGTIGTTSDVTFYAAEEKGWFDYLRIEPVYERFDSGGRNFTALATNQIDVGIGSPSVGLYNAIARGVTAKMVADRASSRAGFNSYQIFARKELVDGGLLRDFADLRGKRIAVAATGTTADVVVGRALELGGLTLADAEILELAYPGMAAAMVTNAIDVGVAPEPSASLAVQRGGAVLWRASDFVPGQAASTMMYSAQFIAQQPDVARDFMVAFLLGARFYNDAFMKRQPEALGEALDMIARRTGLTDRALLERVQVSYIDPNGVLDRQALATDYEWFRQNRGLTATVDLNQAVDDSFANYADHGAGDVSVTRATSGGGVGDDLWVNVESRSHSFPDPPGTVEIRWCFPRFRPWMGEPISYTYGGKAVLELAGEPLFAELVILRLLEREGWQGVWVDTYHGKFRLGLPRVVEPVGLPGEQARRMAAISSVLDPEHFASRPDRVPRGTWDVFAWRGDEVLFVESKRGKRDRMHDHQWIWLAAALRAGLPPEAFVIVEWDLAQPG